MPKRNSSSERDDLLTPSEIEALRREFKESYQRMRARRAKQKIAK